MVDVQMLLTMLAALVTILVPIGVLNYFVIRLAIRSEILALQNDISEKYVTKDECGCIRAMQQKAKA